MLVSFNVFLDVDGTRDFEVIDVPFIVPQFYRSFALTGHMKYLRWGRFLRFI
jgi:hypothetical protein